MMSAADVMTRPVEAMPLTIDVWLSRVARYSSRTRENRNTS